MKSALIELRRWVPQIKLVEVQVSEDTSQDDFELGELMKEKYETNDGTGWKEDFDELYKEGNHEIGFESKEIEERKLEVLGLIAGDNFETKKATKANCK